MSDFIRPPLEEALEWADSAETARRLQTLRWEKDAGWRTDWRPEAVPEEVRRIARTLLGER